MVECGTGTMLKSHLTGMDIGYSCLLTLIE
jgi:hypothetical protein